VNNLVQYATLLLVAVFLVGCTQQAVSETTIVRDEDEEGLVVMTITDDAIDLVGVTSIRVTVDSIQIYSAEEGWVTVMGDEETYDLLAIRDTQRLLAQASVDADTYTQVRLDLSSVIIEDETGAHDAILPSEKYTITADLVVLPDRTSTAMFDFLADQSLHITENGEYVFAPVVAVQTCTNSDVAINNNIVVMTCSEVVTDMTYGMDLQGNVGVNIVVPDRPIIIERGIIKTTVTTINTTRTVYNDRTVYVERNDTNTTTRTNTTANETE
jgi:hypothetical protein